MGKSFPFRVEMKSNIQQEHAGDYCFTKISLDEQRPSTNNLAIAIRVTLCD
jgi:hypothetical protein